MLRTLIGLIEHVKPETETMRIARGKYYLPKTWKEALRICLKK